MHIENSKKRKKASRLLQSGVEGQYFLVFHKAALNIFVLEKILALYSEKDQNVNLD